MRQVTLISPPRSSGEAIVARQPLIYNLLVKET